MHTPKASLFVRAAALSALFCTVGLGQTPPETPDGSAPRERIIPTEVLVAPQLAKPIPLSYPPEEVHQLGEGWVTLGLMVDPTGKPFEVTVNSSSGNKVFEKQAVAAVERATFKPGSLNGQPIESATAFKVVFRFTDPITGARPEFINRYEEFQRAIKAKDQPRADAAMKRLDVNNLYEDAYFGLALYAYALQWGDEARQLAGLQRAIANESGSLYLPRNELRRVKLGSFVLDVKLRHYAEARALWPQILNSGIDADTIEKLRPVMEQLEQIRLRHEAYTIPGSMPDGTWHLRLFEQNFRISVSQGHISQVKLRCSKGFVRFTFDPNIEYNVADKYGSCNMELEGDPGTSFTLTQS